MSCPLCHSSEIILYETVRQKDYFLCNECSYIYMDRTALLVPTEEKSRYDTHNNDREDQGYIDFLNRLLIPLKSKLGPNSNGLDYGSGPGPTISYLLNKEGHNVSDFDIYFANNKELLKDQYDFVTSTEVWEHLYEPDKVIEEVWSLVKPGGHLGVMTYFYPEDKSKFENWWYLRDDTHVGFFNEEVFEYLSKKLNAKLEILSRQVVIFKKEE